MNHVTHMNELCRYQSFILIHMRTGWRRLTGCLKLQVICRKRATNYRALLWKMTHEDQASNDSTPPCKMTRVAHDMQSRHTVEAPQLCARTLCV